MADEIFRPLGRLEPINFDSNLLPIYFIYILAQSWGSLMLGAVVSSPRPPIPGVPSRAFLGAFCVISEYLRTLLNVKIPLAEGSGISESQLLIHWYSIKVERASREICHLRQRSIYWNFERKWKIIATRCLLEAKRFHLEGSELRDQLALSLASTRCVWIAGTPSFIWHMTYCCVFIFIIESGSCRRFDSNATPG